MEMCRDPRVLIYSVCFAAFAHQMFHLFDQRFVNQVYTETKIYERNLQDLEFPIIFKICVLPGFDLEELRSVGYASPRKYFLGQSSQ